MKESDDSDFIFQDLGDEINDYKLNENLNQKLYTNDIFEEAGSANSLRQFYRYKNKVVFQPTDTDQNKNQEQADIQSYIIFDAYISEDVDSEYKRSNKPIKHSEDLEQEAVKPPHKKKKVTISDGSSFRHEEFKRYNHFLNCNRISNRTFLGHSQYQILLMFLVFDFVTILGILVFYFRGTAQKLLPVPTSIESKTLTIGNIIINGNSMNGFRNIGITSRTELIFNSSISIGDTKISKNDGIKCSRLILNGSLYIGDIIFDYNHLEKKFIIDIENESLNIGGHLTVGDVYVQNHSQFGGLIFTNDKCINCITDTTRLTAQILEDDDNNHFKKFNFVPKFQFSMANDDKNLIFGDDISLFCTNNNEEADCQEIFSKSLYPVSADHIIPNHIDKYGIILHAQDFYDNKILRICEQREFNKVSLLIDDTILYEFNFHPQQAFIVPTFEDGKVIQILTTEDKIHIFKSESLFNINNEKIYNEEQIIDNNYGNILKLKAFLNDFGDVVVFAQTEKGLLTFRIYISNFSISPLKLQFPSIKLFDATSRDGDLILVAAASDDGSVLLGRCFDDYCERIKMIRRKSFQTDKIEFIGVSLNDDNRPTVSLSKDGETLVINCQSFLCEDIKTPVWL